MEAGKFCGSKGKGPSSDETGSKPADGRQMNNEDKGELMGRQ